MMEAIISLTGKLNTFERLKREHFICEMFETLLSPLLHA